MSALTSQQHLVLAHLWAVTRDGRFTYRQPKTSADQLVEMGYAVHGTAPDMYRITPAGVACFEGGEPSTVRAWCDDCGAVTVHHCLYDHTTGERFKCAGCAERIAS